MSITNFINKLIEQFYSIADYYLIVLILLVTAFLIQLFYYLFIYSKLLTKKTQQPENTVQFPVSVVISARNEAKNLETFLPSVLEQKYPKFEVIVVNDCSDDNSEEILTLLKRKYSNLYVTTIRKDEKFTHGKKLALSIGIKAAKNEWILLTDADCQPVSENWIASMQKNFSEKTSVVLAYGGYFKEKSLLNLFVRTDTVFIAMQYLSFAKIGFPYMGVGRNLAYKKSLYFNNKGFAKHMHIPSGDDDLFINEVANKSNSVAELSHDSFTLSVPKKTFSEWFTQKRRHLKTGKLYKKRHKLLIGSEIFSRFLFYLSLIILFFSLVHFLVFVSAVVFIFRTTVLLIVFNKISKLFNETKLFAFYIIYDIIQPVFNLSIYLSNRFERRKKRWK